MRIQSAFGCCAVLIAALAGSPARADTDTPKPADLKTILDLLNRIDERISTQNTANAIAFDGVKREIAQLREQVTRLQTEVDSLKARSNVPTTSYYGNATVLAPTVGRVRLVNAYPFEMTAVINDVSYSVAPGQERTVTFLPGTLTYQVLQAQAFPKVSALTAGETLVLTLKPR